MASDAPSAGGLCKMSPILTLILKRVGLGALTLLVISVLIFVGILSLVIVYAWKKGLFEWNRRPSLK